MATVNQTQQLYVTYFGRPADPSGLTYWTTGPQASLPLSEVADYFANNIEFAETIQGKTTSQVINSFYVNAFGRNADPIGLAYWTNKVDQGFISLQDVGLFIGDGALAQPPGSPDRVALESKIAASDLFTAEVAQSTEATLEYAGPLAATYGVEYLIPVTTPATIPSPQATEIFIEGLPPVGTVGLVASSVGSVNEGGTVIFTVTTIPNLAGATLAYELQGVLAADIEGGKLAGTVLVSENGVAVIQVTIASDNLVEIGEILTINFPNNIIFAKPPGSETVFINDTTSPIGSYILTPAQDIVAGTAVPLFTFIGNELTLGQGDRLSIGDAEAAILEVDVAGAFNLTNFSTSGIDTLQINGDGVQAEGDSFVALSNTNIRNILIERSIQNDVLFDDLQIDDLFASITDSVGDYQFNFDASQLNTGFQSATVVLDEVPVDQEEQGVGLYFTQASDNVEAKLEELVIGSFNTSGDQSTNFVNLVREISVGESLETLIIEGSTSLDIERDLGQAVLQQGSAANPFITLIDAENLDADLALTYTTQVQDEIPDNDDPDVTVIGAQGDNVLLFASGEPDLLLPLEDFRPADFSVTTFDGDDAITTTLGDDFIDASGGDNIIDAGAGENTVFAEDGDNIVLTGLDDDLIVLGNGDNIVDAGDGDNLVVVGDGDNLISTGSGDDEIFAGTGSNEIFAGDGDNIVDAGVEIDGTPLEAGDNKVITGSGLDKVNTGNGDDTIVVGDGEDFSADVVNSNGGKDLVITGNGDDRVNSGSDDDNVAVGEGTVTVDLGTGADALWMKANNIEGDDFIDGGSIEAAGIRDSIIFTAGGTVLRSETEGVTNIEQFVLLNLEADPVTVSDHLDVQTAFEETVVGPVANYDLALSNALVDGSNDLSGGVRRFTVDASNALADVTLDLTPVSSRDTTPQRNLVGITYLGSSDGYTETLIVSDQQLNARLIAKFDGTGQDAAGDILEIIDTTDATVSDLRGITGLDVIALDASVNTAQTFTITLDQAFIDANADAADPLIIRATNGLPPGSKLNLNVSAVTSSGLQRSIVVEKTSNLIVNIVGDPNLGTDAAKVQVVDAFFLTSNSDDINGTVNDDLIVADSAADLNPSDNVNGGAGFDTMLFKFGVNDAQLDFSDLDQIEDTTGYVSLLGAFTGGPILTSMMVGLPTSIWLFEEEAAAVWDEVITQVTNQLESPVAVDPLTFEGIFDFVTDQFVSSSQPNFQDGGVSIAALPFAPFATPRGQTLESQLNFIDVENVEKFVFDPVNDNGVRFVGFNSLETFEFPGFETGDAADAQIGQLDLVSLEILQTFDSNTPNAGADFALIEGNGAPLNDILFLDDFSWNLDNETVAEAFWSNENGNMRRAKGSSDLDFALEVDTGAGNDYVWRGVFGDSANGLDIGEVVSGHYLAGYLVDTGSGDDVVTLDDVEFGYGPEGVAKYGLFGGYNIIDVQGEDFNAFSDLGNPFYGVDGAIEVGDTAEGFYAFADDVVLTRSGNDFVVDYGGDNIVYSGIGNDFVLTGLGNDVIVSDAAPELDATFLESEVGIEAIVGPGVDGTDNDIVLADGPLVSSFLQFNADLNPLGTDFFLLGQVSPGVFGADTVIDLTGDNIISTGGEDDSVDTGLGNDIIFAGTLGDLGQVGKALYLDSDNVTDLGGHNLIVTLGDDDTVTTGDGSDVILAGFGNDDDDVRSGDGSDLIEIAAGQDYVDAGDGNDLIASLLGASSPVLSLIDGDWNGISTGDTLLGGDGIDSLLLAFGGSQDDIVIAPRLVITSNPDGSPQTVSAPPAPGAYPASYGDAVNGEGSVNPILDSLENFILVSDDADIYLTDTVAKQAGNLVEVAPDVFADQVSVFLNDLEYDGIGSGVDIVLDASAFEANSSLRAFAYNIGASSLQNGIQGSAGLIGGSGIDFLAAGSFLEEGILEGEAVDGLADSTDIANMIDEIASFLDNQALDNFVGLDVVEILTGILDEFGNDAADIIQVLLPLYPQPGENAVAQIQASLDLISGIFVGDFVEDFITYQGNGGGDIITLEPTLLDPSGDPIVSENTVEFVRYETTRDGANAGVASGFDQVFNFNNSDTCLPYNDIGSNAATGELTNSYQFLGFLPTTTSRVVADGGSFDDIAGDKIVLAGNVGQLGDIVSKNGNQLVDLFEVNSAVNWSSGETTDIVGEANNYFSGDEALFVDYAIQDTNDQITNFDDIIAKVNSFGTSVAGLNQGGLIVVNGGDKAIYAVYQETDGNFAKIDRSEVSILGLVKGIDTNSFRLQASDFIIDNSFITYTNTGITNVPLAGNIFDAQAVTDPFIPV